MDTPALPYCTHTHYTRGGNLTRQHLPSAHISKAFPCSETICLSTRFFLLSVPLQAKCPLMPLHVLCHGTHPQPALPISPKSLKEGLEELFRCPPFEVLVPSLPNSWEKSHRSSGLGNAAPQAPASPTIPSFKMTFSMNTCADIQRHASLYVNP